MAIDLCVLDVIEKNVCIDSWFPLKKNIIRFLEAWVRLTFFSFCFFKSLIGTEHTFYILTKISENKQKIEKKILIECIEFILIEQTLETIKF